MRQRRPPARDKKYITWALAHLGGCCLCSDAATDVHHIDVYGMGTKCSDHKVARVCQSCHRRIQGKGRIAMMRTDEWRRVRIDLLEDALDLLDQYVEETR